MNTNVKNMRNANGNKVANQFIIESNGRTYFQSYQSIIVCINTSGQVEIDKYYWNYSKTTSKYRSIFLNESTKETEAKIKNGTYILTDLN